MFCTSLVAINCELALLHARAARGDNKLVPSLETLMGRNTDRYGEANPATTQNLSDFNSNLDTTKSGQTPYPIVPWMIG